MTIPPVSVARYLVEFPFTGPGRLAGTYMRLFWQPVARSVDLPIGRSKPITVMNVRYTLYRGQSGEPYVVDHHCPHRGTQLSAGYVEGEAIRCVYHGWKFGGGGACLERPGEKGRSGAGRLRTLDDVKDHPMLVEIEDLLAQGGQGSIADRHAERLGRTDAGVVRLRRLFARELHAVAQGLPTTRWTPCPLIKVEGAYGRVSPPARPALAPSPF